MSARASSVVAAFVALVDNASGLTGTGKVIRGRPPQGRPATVPAAYVWTDGLVSALDGEALTQFRRELTIRIVVYAQGSSMSPADREDAALTMLDDIVAAVEADRSIAGLVHDVILDGAAVNGDDFGLSGLLAAELEARVYWSADSGAGL